MSARHDQTAQRRLMGVGGLLYLVIISCGLYSELGVRAALIVPGDASTTAARLLASPGLFRLGFVCDTLMLMADVAIAVVLYRLFRGVDGTLSLTAAAFRLMQATIIGGSLLVYYAALLVLIGRGEGAGLEAAQAHVVMLMLLELHAHGYDLGLLFFGVSNLLLGWLAIRSDFVPAVLGYGLIGAGLVYLLGGYGHFLVPAWLPAIQPLYLVPLIAEIAFCLWLLWRSRGAWSEIASE